MNYDKNKLYKDKGRGLKFVCGGGGEEKGCVEIQAQS